MPQRNYNHLEEGKFNEGDLTLLIIPCLQTPALASSYPQLILLVPPPPAGSRAGLHPSQDKWAGCKLCWISKSTPAIL